MSLTPIADAFNEYIAAVYGGAPLPDAQRDELKQAFYGGVNWLMQTGQVGLDDTDEAGAFGRRLTSDLRTYVVIREASLKRRAAQRAAAIAKSGNGEG